MQTSTAIFWADRGPTPLPPSATKSAGVQAQWFVFVTPPPYPQANLRHQADLGNV